MVPKFPDRLWFCPLRPPFQTCGRSNVATIQQDSVNCVCVVLTMWSSSTSLIHISSVRRTKRACSRSYEQWTRPTATALGTWRRGTCRPWCQLLWGPTFSSTCILSQLLRWLILTHLVWNLEALDLIRGSSWYWRKKRDLLIYISLCIQQEHVTKKVLEPWNDFGSVKLHKPENIMSFCFP